MITTISGATTAEVNALVVKILGADEDARYEAAAVLSRLGRQAVVVAHGLIASPITRSREMGCYVLGQVSDPEQEQWTRLPDGIPALLTVLETDPDERVRGWAAIALGHHDAEEATPLLCLLAAAFSPDARFDAAWALGSFGEGCWERSPQFKVMAETALLALTHDEDEDVRDWAVFGLHLGDHNTPEVLSRFWEALDDGCAEVRGEAAAGLGKFGDRSFIPRLIELLESETGAPLYFEATEYLGDPALLPAILAAEQRWRDSLDEGEEMHHYVTSAVAALTGIAIDDARSLNSK